MAKTRNTVDRVLAGAIVWAFGLFIFGMLLAGVLGAFSSTPTSGDGVSSSVSTVESAR